MQCGLHNEFALKWQLKPLLAVAARLSKQAAATGTQLGPPTCSSPPSQRSRHQWASVTPSANQTTPLIRCLMLDDTPSIDPFDQTRPENPLDAQTLNLASSQVAIYLFSPRQSAPSLSVRNIQESTESRLPHHDLQKGFRAEIRRHRLGRPANRTSCPLRHNPSSPSHLQLPSPST